MSLRNLFLIGVLMFFSSCTTPTYTPEELRRADESSLKETVAIASIREQVEEQVALFISVFSAYQRQEIAEAVPKLYAEDAFLNDRIHSVNGRKAIADYFDGTFAKMHSSEFQVHDTLYGERDLFLRWTMRIQLREGEKFMEFLGTTDLRFNAAGEIIYHQDFWDFSELMSEFSILRSIVSYVKRRA